MGRKHLGFLQASVVDGRVRLTGYKTTSAFSDERLAAAFQVLRVYRQETPEFTFDKDYAEFFDGLDYRQGTVLHEGPMEFADGRKFTFEDRTARIGSTYTYWVSAGTGEPTGPVAVRVRDPDVWWSQQRLQRELEALKDKYPLGVEIEILGRTVRQRPVTGLRVGRGPVSLAFVGAVHAGESGAELMIGAFEQLLAEHKEALDQTSIVAIPVLNLDEREREVQGVPWYLRANANGVDLNRNFPVRWEVADHGYGMDSSDPDSMTYRGPFPASEPETRIVMDWLRRARPTVVYAFHSLAGICGGCFLGPAIGHADTALVERCRPLALAYGRGMAPEYPEEKFLTFSATAGSLSAWCYGELNTPCVDIEMAGEKPFDRVLETIRKDGTDLPLLTEFRRRHCEGILGVMNFLRWTRAVKE
jgi:hypothetical protein